ncbi:hypothetical protein CDAR_229471 [Caerostris darwini]|uniref:Uncharacterized protein n=1 Tax=Caerostris darwini TaxID=1538125 RepID=A0AAV4PY64_9ARAC|nr:hypothetical protein CDAR_229471 [Caerostris darwini]
MGITHVSIKKLNDEDIFKHISSEFRSYQDYAQVPFCGNIVFFLHRCKKVDSSDFYKPLQKAFGSSKWCARTENPFGVETCFISGETTRKRERIKKIKK